MVNDSGNSKFDIVSAALPELRDFMGGLGQEPFRAAQVYEWIHKKHAPGFSDMTSIPLKLREKLEETTHFQGVVIKKRIKDAEGVIKYLLEIENHTIIRDKGLIIEAVYMDYRHGGACCVSTQAGCKMGCAFCVSGKEGFMRNLTPGEMLSQVYAVSRDSARRISNVTLMGCGEPLDNFDNVISFIRLLNAPEGMNLGQRRITLSTCGLTDKIYALLPLKLQITLAVSLHAPSDDIRRKLMPSAAAHPLPELLKACREYANATKRRITYEYAMISGLNDSPRCATELARKLKGSLCHVNLIPVNASGSSFLPSPPAAVRAFMDSLNAHGIPATVRRTLGSNINAACGQLKAQNKNLGVPTQPVK